jgi:hypothetical protein
MSSKAHADSITFAARLKSCPVTKLLRSRYNALEKPQWSELFCSLLSEIHLSNARRHGIWAAEMGNLKREQLAFEADISNSDAWHSANVPFVR